MNKETLEITREIAKEVVEAARKIMEGPTGINPKVGKNTLKDSELYRNIQWEVNTTDSVVVKTFFNHYLYYLEWDRPPQYGKMPPIDAILKWMKRKRIAPTNKNARSVAFLISRAIWRDGWKGRKVMEKMGEYADGRWEERWADELFNALMTEINNYFK